MDEASVVCEYVDEVAVKDGRPCILCTPAKSNTPRMARASLAIPLRTLKTLSDFDDDFLFFLEILPMLRRGQLRMTSMTIVRACIPGPLSTTGTARSYNFGSTMCARS